ncbi:MAG: hypothetical protein WCF17_09815 [Terracidiphilus sp.]
MVFALLPVILAAIVGLAYAWVVTFQEMRAAEAPGWRQTTALLSVGAVTMQVLLCGAMLLFLANNGRAIDWIMGVEVLVFFIALPCAILRKGFTRWGLIFSSIYFLAFAGFVFFVSGIRF